MTAFLSSMGFTLLEWLLSLCALVCLVKCDTKGDFKPLRFLLTSRVAFTSALVPMLLLAGKGIEVHLAYRMYFCGYWLGFASEAALSLLVIYRLFNLTMAPLDGIKDLGAIVFHWFAVVSVILTAAVTFVPHPNGSSYVTRLLTDLQRAQGVLTLCLLLFVCFALKPLGLNYRSRTFGVIIGLGILATSILVSAGWLAYYKQVYSHLNLMNSVATCTALLVWIGYFVVPEPKRQMVILPTTSPYLRWNRVAEVLGDPPGFVAIAGVPPEMFAPAEIEVMKRASKMMVPPRLPLTYLIEQSEAKSA